MTLDEKTLGEWDIQAQSDQCLDTGRSLEHVHRLRRAIAEIRRLQASLTAELLRAERLSQENEALRAWRDKAESLLHESLALCRHAHNHEKRDTCTYCTEVSDLLARSPGRK